MNIFKLFVSLSHFALVLGSTSLLATVPASSEAEAPTFAPPSENLAETHSGNGPSIEPAVEPIIDHPHFGAITGRVTNEFGQPLAGIVVEVKDRYYHNHHASTTTDAAGRYRFDGLYSSHYAVFIDESEYLAESYDNQPCWDLGCNSSIAEPPTRIGVVDGETTTGIDFRLERPATIYLVDRGPDPDLSRDYYFDHLGQVPPVAYFHRFWPGTYYAVGTSDYGISEMYDGIPCPGFHGNILLSCDLSQGTPVQVGSGEVRELSMPIHQGVNILPRLTDAATGETLYGDFIVWDGAGRYIGFDEQLSPGDYHVLAVANDRVSTLWPNTPCPLGPPLGCDPTSGGKVHVGNEHLELSMSMPLGGSIVAKVYADGDDYPLSDYIVEVFDSNGRTIGIDEEGYTEKTFLGLPAGQYVLAAYYRGRYYSELGYQGEFNDGRLCHRDLENGCRPAGSTPITVVAGQTTDVDFFLAPFGGVSGSLGPFGKRVEVWSLSGEPVESTFQTTEEGYRFRHLPPGQYRFSTAPQAFVPNDEAVDQLYPGIQCPGGPGVGCDLEMGAIVSFAPGEVRTGIDFDLHPGGSIQGTVTVRSTQLPPAIGARVYAFDSQGHEMGWTWLEDGLFQLGGLASGDYTLRTVSSNPGLLPSVFGGGSCGDCDAKEGTPVAVTIGQSSGPVAIELDSRVSWCSLPGKACLLENRFLVEGAMETFDTPPAQFDTRAMTFDGGRAESDQAVFFESFSPGNFELGVKMVDGCALPENDPLHAYWVFIGGLTNAESDIEIQDTVSGQRLTWHNPRGEFPRSYANTRAFSCSDGIPNCVRSEDAACLLDGRFRITGVMEDFANPPVAYPANVMNFPQGKAVSRQAAFFESFSPGNFEVGVKMVDGCDLPFGHPQRGYWIFYGGLTNAATTLRVTQLDTGITNLWEIEAGQLPLSEGRINAFECE